MKALTVLLTITLLTTMSVSSQQASVNVTEQKNHIMFDPFALAFGNIQIQYERVLTHNLSLGLSVGVKTSSGIFNIPGFNTSTIVTEDFSFSGIQLTPELRWYFQETKRNHTGFYLGTYYRFQNYKDDVKGSYTSLITESANPIDVEVKTITNTVGFEVGYKLPIKKHFYIDFLIAGPGVSFNKIKISEKQALPLEFYIVDVGTAIVEEFGVLNLLNANIDFSETSDSGGDSTFILPAFHYGIRVGYSF